MISKDFLELNKKISFSQINLKLFLEFYKNEICNYTYEYLLEDDSKIILLFEENSFSHLLGLHKFNKIKKYKKAIDINNDILSEKIIFKDLFNNRKEISNELIDRLTFFPTLKTLINNTSTVLEYNINTIFNSKIKFSFLLNSNKINVIVYLAIKEIKENTRICIPVSFLVDRVDKFRNLNLKEIKITSIQKFPR